MGIDVKYLEIFYFITPIYNTITNIFSIFVGHNRENSNCHRLPSSPPPHLYLSFKIRSLDFNGDFGPPFGPTVGWRSNLPQDITKGVGGKNSTTSVASYLALTFFLKKVRYFFHKNTGITLFYSAKY